MATRHTRRNVLKLASGLGLVLSGMRISVATAAEQPDISSGGIGLTRSAWEAIVGEGNSAGALVEYANPDLDGFTLFARFGGGERITHLEFGYEETQLGGLLPDDVRGQILGAMPADTRLMETFVIAQHNRSRTQFRVERFISRELGQMSNGLASILAVTQEMEKTQAPGQPMVTVVPRITLTMPGPYTLEARNVGDPGGIAMTHEEWTRLYGSPEPTQSGVVYPSPFAPDLSLLVRFGQDDRAHIVSTIQPGGGESLDYAVAKQLTGTLLPTDALMRETFLIPPTPEGPSGLFAELWECPSLAGETNEIGWVLAFFVESAGEEHPVVTRLAVALPIAPVKVDG